jgi:hypothetical protein
MAEKQNAVATQEDAPIQLVASAQVITDMQTVINNGPTANTQAASIAAAGPIGDYIGNTKLVQLKFQEAKQLLLLVIAGTDAADPSLTLLNNVNTTLV